MDEYTDRYIEYCPSGVKLKTVQAQAIDSVLNHIRNGKNNGYVNHATGVGKTLFATVLSSYLIDNNKFKKILWLTHRVRLVKQSIDQFKKVIHNKNITTTTITQQSKSHNGDMVFATLQCFINYSKSINKDTFDFVIVDEAHWVSNDNHYKIALSNINYKFLLGLSATPNFNYKHNNPFIDNVIHSVGITDAIKKDMLCSIKYYRVEKINKRKHTNKVIDDNKDHSSMLTIQGINRLEQILDVFVPNITTFNKSLFFCTTIEQCGILKDLLKERLSDSYPIYVIHSNLKPNENNRIMDEFRQKKDAILINVRILTEGVDEPSINTVVITTNTNNNRLITQIIGRCLRKHSSKPNNIGHVIDGGDICSVFLYLNKTFDHVNVITGKGEVEKIKQEEEIIEIIEDINNLDVDDVDVPKKYVKQAYLNNNIHGVIKYTHNSKETAILCTHDRLATVRSAYSMLKENKNKKLSTLQQCYYSIWYNKTVKTQNNNYIFTFSQFSNIMDSIYGKFFNFDDYYCFDVIKIKDIVGG